MSINSLISRIVLYYPQFPPPHQPFLTTPFPEAIIGVPIGAVKSVPRCILLNPSIDVFSYQREESLAPFIAFSLKLFGHFFHFCHNVLHFLFYQNSIGYYFLRLILNLQKEYFILYNFAIFIFKNFIHNLKTISFSYISLEIYLETVYSCKFNYNSNRNFLICSRFI